MKKEYKVCVYGILLFTMSVVVHAADSCKKINLHYNERIPYLVTTSEKNVTGLTGTPAALAFKLAEVDFSWERTPSKRQMYILEQNQGCDCLVGWFKNAKREKFAKYTLPIYQDKSQIALARADNNKITSGESLETVFQNDELVLLIKDGYSYGDFLDNKIAEHKPRSDASVIENVTMLKKIYFKRGDYFFISPEEAESLVASSEYSKKYFKYIAFSDVPKGEQRYILCSQKVDDLIIHKLNKAISEIRIE